MKDGGHESHDRPGSSQVTNRDKDDTEGSVCSIRSSFTLLSALAQTRPRRKMRNPKSCVILYQ